MATSVTRRLTLLAIGGLLLLGVASCGGGGAEMRSDISTTTTGQQLIDLKKALDAGAITQKEYERERQKILDRK